MTTKIKLAKPRGIRQVHDAIYSIELAHALALQTVKAERLAQVTVHSHGQALNRVIAELEEAISRVKAFQKEVEGR